MNNDDNKKKVVIDNKTLSALALKRIKDKKLNFVEISEQKGIEKMKEITKYYEKK